MIRIIAFILSIIGLSIMLLFIYHPRIIEINDNSIISNLIANQAVEFSGDIIKISPSNQGDLITLDNKVSFQFSSNVPSEFLNQFVTVSGKIQDFNHNKYIQGQTISVL